MAQYARTLTRGQWVFEPGDRDSKQPAKEVSRSFMVSGTIMIHGGVQSFILTVKIVDDDGHLSNRDRTIVFVGYGAVNRRACCEVVL